MILDFDLVAISTAYDPPSEVRERCERSIAAQTVPIQHIYVDAARDGGACLENVYNIVHDLPSDTVVLWVDGDDCLARPDAAAIVLGHYLRGAWMTWGQYAPLTGSHRPVCRDADNRRACRREGWYASHLRTFRAGLFQRIARSDLFLDEEWSPECCDLATMWPMLEMADDRGRFIEDVLYVYDDAARRARRHDDPTTVLGRRQMRAERMLRAKTPYRRLEEAPWAVQLGPTWWDSLELPDVETTPKTRAPIRWGKRA